MSETERFWTTALILLFRGLGKNSHFVATADLTDYDLSSMTPMHFEFQPKDRSITMRLSESLFEAIREEADRSGMPYQRFIRKALEEAVHQPST